MALKAGYQGVKHGKIVIPIGSSTKVGGVKPVSKTPAMTKEVGVTSAGKLYTAADIPPYTISDAGKVLKVGEDGSLLWSEPPSGGNDNYTINDFIYKDDVAFTGSEIISKSGFKQYYIPLKNDITNYFWILLAEVNPYSEESGNYFVSIIESLDVGYYTSHYTTSFDDHILTDKTYDYEGSYLVIGKQNSEGEVEQINFDEDVFRFYFMTIHEEE